MVRTQSRRQCVRHNSLIGRAFSNLNFFLTRTARPTLGLAIHRDNELLTSRRHVYKNVCANPYMTAEIPLLANTKRSLIDQHQSSMFSGLTLNISYTLVIPAATFSAALRRKGLMPSIMACFCSTALSQPLTISFFSADELLNIS